MTSFVPAFVETHKTIAKETGRRFRIRRPTVQLHPRGVERSFAAELTAIIDLIKADIDEFLVPEIARLSRVSQLRPDVDRQDIEDIDAILGRIRATVTTRVDKVHLRNLEEMVSRQFNDTATFSRRQTMRQLKRMLGVEVFAQETQIEVMRNLFLSDNAARIESLAGSYVSGVSGAVSRRIAAGDRPVVIEADLLSIFKTTKNKAKLIARDQVNKLNGQLTRMRQTNLGIEQYIWRTSRDERVRASHLALEGMVQNWDDPPSVGHPGQDILCRCSAEPVIEGSPPPKENRREVIAEVKRKREALRKRLKGKKSARLIARD